MKNEMKSRKSSFPAQIFIPVTLKKSAFISANQRQISLAFWLGGCLSKVKDHRIKWQ
jgi:hypothetical protein